MIRSILQSSAFTPEQIKQIIMAYEAALAELNLHNRNDPLRVVVAKAVIAIAETGERDPLSICSLALAHLETLVGRQFPRPEGMQSAKKATHRPSAS